MCNLIGFSGYRNDNRDVRDIKKNILFLLATAKERGDDGCGLFANGIRKIGFMNTEINGVKVDTSCPVHFAIKTDFDNFDFEQDNVLLAHNRKSSYGGINKAAIHPYLYEYEDSSVLAFMHNGTIRNVLELAKKYGFTAREYETDSDLLGLILYHKEFKEFKKVLASYEGGANFIWHYTWEPNVMYVWKGASTSEYTLNGTIKKTIIEDRPLYYGTDETGLYINSTELPLKALGLNDIKSFDNNIITIIENGKIIKKIKINREVKYSTAHTIYGAGTNSIYRAANTYPSSNVTYTAPDIYKHVSNPHNIAKGGIYWYKGLYYHKGVPCDGIYYFNQRGKLTRNPKSNIRETLYFTGGHWVKNEFIYKTCVTNRNAYADIKHYKPMITQLHEDSVHIYTTSVYKGGTFACTVTSKINTNVDIQGRFMFYDYEIIAEQIVEGTAYNVDRYGNKTGVRLVADDGDDKFTDYEALSDDYSDNWDDSSASELLLKELFDNTNDVGDNDDHFYDTTEEDDLINRGYVPRIIIHDEPNPDKQAYGVVKYLPPVIVDNASDKNNQGVIVQRCIDYYNTVNYTHFDTIVEVNEDYRNMQPDFIGDILFNDIESLEVFIHNYNHGTALKKKNELVCAYKFNSVNNY